MTIDTLIQEFCAKHHLSGNTPGFCLLLRRGKTLIKSFCIGYRDTKNQPVTAQTNFRLASASKQMTAACILQLVEKKRLSFESTIADLFFDFPAYGRNINIAHLLSHTSGLQNYEDHLHLIPRQQVGDNDVLDLAKTWDGTLFAPGSRFSYSNGAYCLLALIVTQVSGLPFEEYLRDHIFGPAGMSQACLNTHSAIARRAYGFSFVSGAWRETDQNKTSATQGDGGIYASCEALMDWHKALYHNETILSSSSRRWMTTPRVATSQPNECYGGGLYIGPNYHRHDGSSIGFSNALFYLPGQDISLAILSNMNNFDMVSWGKQLINELPDNKIR